MRLRFLYAVVVGALIATMSACSSIYMPNVPATPMFTNLQESFTTCRSDHIHEVFLVTPRVHFIQHIGEQSLPFSIFKILKILATLIGG